jgi:adenosylhomocysteine nucleosidase
MTTPHVLVVSATRAEAAHLPEGIPVIITGVGKVSAASALARALALDPTIELVVNIGSCGALRPGLSGIFEIGTVINHDFSAEAIRALGYEIEDEIVISASEWALATGDLFVTDPAVRDALAERAHLVDMEGFAVVWAAREAGVPVRMVKHVSDHADETALDWVQVVDGSARALADWLRAGVLRE